MIKKIVFGIINVFSVLIIIAAVFVLCTVIFTKSGEAPSVFGYTALRVTTGSMKPTYDVDTLIVVKKVDPETIKVNDVISFYSQDPVLDGAVNTHRVVEILEEEQGRVFVTKGDNNNVTDAYNVESEYLIGKVVASSIVIGKISRSTRATAPPSTPAATACPARILLLPKSKRCMIICCWPSLRITSPSASWMM